MKKRQMFNLEEKMAKIREKDERLRKHIEKERLNKKSDDDLKRKIQRPDDPTAKRVKQLEAQLKEESKKVERISVR